MEDTYLPPHHQLKKAREDAAWSIDRVAFTLNLPVDAIQALESGSYEKLHGDAFVMGYIRSYADLFSLDANYLVSLYRREASQASGEADLSNTPVNKGKWLNAGYGIAAVITLMASLTLLTPRDIEPEVQYNAISTITVETAVGTTVISSLEELPSENPTSELLPTVTWSNDAQKLSLNEEQKRRILDDGSAANSSNPELSFQFSADCWVEILDGDNKLIYANLQKADQKLELTGKPPFHITLGYAPGVALSYNGQPVDIDTSSANIAKLVLGNS